MKIGTIIAAESGRRSDILNAISAPRARVTASHLPTTSEERCGNGRCTKKVYRGKECYRCWAGTKWTSMHQRIENVNGRCSSYVGMEMGFSRESFLNWVLGNHPPEGMEKPSIDRINPSLGYVPGNIQWIESVRNSRNVRRDDPDGMKFCSGCQTLKPATLEFFGRYSPSKKYVFYKLQGHCRECRKGHK